MDTKDLNYLLFNITSDPSDQVACNVPLLGLFEVRKKINTQHIPYTLYIAYTQYIPYRLYNIPYKWYIIYPIKGI